jgi:hypothetical protein
VRGRRLREGNGGGHGGNVLSIFKLGGEIIFSRHLHLNRQLRDFKECRTLTSSFRHPAQKIRITLIFVNVIFIEACTWGAERNGLDA